MMRKLNSSQIEKVKGGVYYHWHCYTTGYKSARYWVKSEAETVARYHEQRYAGHQTYVKTYY